MMPYSIHVAIILATCLLFYKALLHKETFYRLNRIILLACMSFAFILPLIPVPKQFSFRMESTVIASGNETQVNTKELSMPDQSGSAIEDIKKPAAQAIPYEISFTERLVQWGFWLYWFGVAAFGANLLLQVAVLLYQSYRRPVIKDGIYRIVELETDRAPCSFGNSIFINPAKYDWEIYNQILMHEKVHIQQGHSFDLILAELMLVFQWFNPFAWLYRKELENNLEFLTDDSVLNHNPVEAANYQLNLLKVSVPNFSLSIATNYNQSLLKKRIVMMNAKKSNLHTMWKYFMLMPLFVLMISGLNKTIAMSGNDGGKQIVNNIPRHSKYGVSDRVVGLNDTSAMIITSVRKNDIIEAKPSHADSLSTTEPSKLYNSIEWKKYRQEVIRLSSVTHIKPVNISETAWKKRNDERDQRIADSYQKLIASPEWIQHPKDITAANNDTQGIAEANAKLYTSHAWIQHSLNVLAADTKLYRPLNTRSSGNNTD